MKIVRSRFASETFASETSGSVEMIPEESDDLWISHNLIAPGDSVMGANMRKLHRITASGMTETLVNLELEIKVEKVVYNKKDSVLKLKGKSIRENENVQIGQSCILQIELHEPFVLRKVLWDSLAIDVIEQLTNPSANADLAVVLMQEGLAHILLVGKCLTITRSRIINSTLLQQGPSTPFYTKALYDFYENVLSAFVKHIDLEVVQCAVIASPDLTRDGLISEAKKRNLSHITDNLSRILQVQSTSGYKQSLREVLEHPNVMQIIKDTKAAKEITALNEFFTMLEKDPHSACYGLNHVKFAHERGAVQTLLITDDLYRRSDIATRQRYVDLVNTVKASGGTALVISSMHVSGERLTLLNGIAAILRSPLPNLDEIET